MTDFLNVITTTSTRKEAKLIANKLINKKLAALCTNNWSYRKHLYVEEQKRDF
jgi:uncharacterized protein involved in tolerance to divalent cations